MVQFNPRAQDEVAMHVGLHQSLKQSSERSARTPSGYIAQACVLNKEVVQSCDQDQLHKRDCHHCKCGIRLVVESEHADINGGRGRKWLLGSQAPYADAQEAGHDLGQDERAAKQGQTQEAGRGRVLSWDRVMR